MKKKGISAIVATVLIILITVAAISIIWVAIMPTLKESSTFDDPNVRLEILTSGGYTFYDAENQILEVQVRRGSDDEDMIALAFKVSLNGNSISFSKDSNTGKSFEVPTPNGVKTYYLNLQSYLLEWDVETVPDSVSVVPIFKRGETNKSGIVTEVVVEKKRRSSGSGYRSKPSVPDTKGESYDDDDLTLLPCENKPSCEAEVSFPVDRGSNDTTNCTIWECEACGLEPSCSDGEYSVNEGIDEVTGCIDWGCLDCPSSDSAGCVAGENYSIADGTDPDTGCINWECADCVVPECVNNSYENYLGVGNCMTYICDDDACGDMPNCEEGKVYFGAYNAGCMDYICCSAPQGCSDGIMQSSPPSFFNPCPTFACI